MKPTIRTLIVDDEVEIRNTIKSILPKTFERIGFDFKEADNGKKALDLIKSDRFDLVLMDVRMPEMDGLTALKEIKNYDPRIFVVLMTAHGNASHAVSAIKEGAFDYFEKPIRTQQLIKTLDACLSARELVLEVGASNPIFDDDLESEFVGNSSQMKEVFNLIYKLSKVDTTVLIRGENGTGKELVAKAIHYNSIFKSGQFVAVNCGAIPENLIESEFFGHEKGAFTGANDRKVGRLQYANNGTLFLDEIGELKPDMQVKLLRAIQEKSFTPVGSNKEYKTNVRFIAATNRNLEKMIQQGNFREDLFYRLNVLPIFIPPLRERISDLDNLIEFFIRKFNKRHNKNILGITTETMTYLRNYNWPGNIRELENFIERAFVIESGSLITNSSLPENIIKSEIEEKIEVKSKIQKNTDVFSPLDYDSFKEDMEKEFIMKALRQNNGKINQTVANAGIPKNTLLRKMRKYGIIAKDVIENS